MFTNSSTQKREKCSARPSPISTPIQLTRSPEGSMTPEREDSSESSSSTSLIVPTLKSDLPPKNKPCFRSVYFVGRQNTHTNGISQNESSQPETGSENSGKDTLEVQSQEKDLKTPTNVDPRSLEAIKLSIPQTEKKRENGEFDPKTGESKICHQKMAEKNDEKLLESPDDTYSRPLQLEDGEVFFFEDESYPKRVSQHPDGSKENSDVIMTKENYLDGYLASNLAGIESSKDDKIQFICSIEGCSCAQKKEIYNPEEKQRNSSDRNQLPPYDVNTKNDSQSSCKNKQIMMADIMESQLNFTFSSSSQENKRKPSEAGLAVTPKNASVSESQKLSTPKNSSPILKFFPLSLPKEVIVSSYEKKETSNFAKNNQENSQSNKNKADLTLDGKRENFTIGRDSIKTDEISSFRSSPILIDSTMGVMRKAKSSRQAALVESGCRSSKMISSVSFSGICSNNVLTPESPRDLDSSQRRSSSSTKLDQQLSETGNRNVENFSRNITTNYFISSETECNDVRRNFES